MKKFFVLCIFTCFVCHIKAQQLKFTSTLEEKKAEIADLSSKYTEWKTDGDGLEAALIRVKVENMSVEEMGRLKVIPGPSLSLNGSGDFLPEKQEWWLFVRAGKGSYVEMRHPTFGTSTRLSIDKQLEVHHIYYVTLINDKTTNIFVDSKPQGATVYIDGNNKGKTPLELSAQTYGTHELKLVYNGDVLTKSIDVEDGSSSFTDFDFRERQSVRITSDPRNAMIFIDGELIGEAPQICNLVYGAHVFKAVLNNSQIDEVSVNVNSSTESIELHPVKTCELTVTTKYAGASVAAGLVVDNEDRRLPLMEHNLLLPYGKHRLIASYSGKTKEKTVRLSTPQRHEKFNISARNSFTWPWERQFNQRPFGMTFGYINKQCVAKGENGYADLKFEPAYGQENKWMHGVQMGAIFNPAMSLGLGLYSGLLFDLYFMSDDDVEYNSFTEISMTIPVHASFRIPLSENIGLHLHGGVGFDIGLYAEFSDGSGNTLTEYYGEEGWPQAFNMTADIGLMLNFGGFAINAFYSKGIINHKDMTTEEAKTHMNRWGVSLLWLMGGE